MTDRTDNRWWDRNHQVISYLNQGKTIREIAAIVGTGSRHIRIIRERLYDFRANALEPVGVD